MLPAYGVTGSDVDAVKFTQVLRGYKTSEVDWVLDRLARELGRCAAGWRPPTRRRANSRAGANLRNPTTARIVRTERE